MEINLYLYYLLLMEKLFRNSIKKLKDVFLVNWKSEEQCEN